MENNYDIITRINKAYSGMSKRHKQIASYILEHYDQAAFMTAAKMGEALSISESTVVRFAAAIGYEGYPEMQAALAAWVKTKLNADTKGRRRLSWQQPVRGAHQCAFQRYGENTGYH